MADYSNARFNISVFQQKAKNRTSDKAPHATGNLEIKVADLNEFFSLAMALEPVDNWEGEQVVKLRCAVWHRTMKDGRPWESISVTPEHNADWKDDAEIIQPHIANKPPLVAATVVADDEEI